jgi:hypothetical protein
LEEVPAGTHLATQLGLTSSGLSPDELRWRKSLHHYDAAMRLRLSATLTAMWPSIWSPAIEALEAAAIDCRRSAPSIG